MRDHITFETYYPHTPERVWQALTDPGQLGRWLAPTDFTLQNALDRLGDRDPWAESMPAAQALPPDLVDEGGAIPVARVQAMHEGKRRARSKDAAE